ncbi:hypothetical protein BH18ACT14_BH18ACT14_10250 [soil metagenome]
MINEATAHTAVAEAGARDQFDVVGDGSGIFSKEREGRFPDTDEILVQL